MARRNNKVAKGANSATGANSDAVPSFDDKALLALTAKIEQGFGGASAGKSKAAAAEASQSKSKKSKLANGSASAVPEAASKGKGPESKRGTKRDSQGNAKSDSKPKARKEKGSEKVKDGKPQGDRETLLQEILALGGTEEDLDLVVDAASDEEDEAIESGPADKALQKELAKFVAGLGIESQFTADGPESEVDEEQENGEEEEEEDWEEASDSDSDVPDARPVTLNQKIVTASKGLPPSSNDPNRLVSTMVSIVE